MILSHSESPVTKCMLCGGLIPAKYDTVYLNHMNDHHRAFVNIDFLFHASLLSVDKLAQLRDAIKNHAVVEHEYISVSAIKGEVGEEKVQLSSTLSNLENITIKPLDNVITDEKSTVPDGTNLPDMSELRQAHNSIPEEDETETKSFSAEKPRGKKTGRPKTAIKEKKPEKKYRSLSEVNKQLAEIGCKCDIRFRSIKARIRHKQVVHKNWFGCDSCVAVFKTLELLNQHSAKRHPNGPKWSKSNVCGECGMVVKHYSQMSAHIAFYHDDTVYNCDKCGMDKKGKARMKKHMKSHELREKHYQPKECPECKKIVRNMPLHQKTMHMIDELKPLSCEVCGKRFGINKALKEHVVIHTDVRAFECRYGCGFASKTAGNRTKHEIQKHNAKSEKDIKSEMQMKQENN